MAGGREGGRPACYPELRESAGFLQAAGASGAGKRRRRGRSLKTNNEQKTRRKLNLSSLIQGEVKGRFSWNAGQAKVAVAHFYWVPESRDQGKKGWRRKSTRKPAGGWALTKLPHPQAADAELE